MTLKHENTKKAYLHEPTMFAKLRRTSYILLLLSVHYAVRTSSSITVARN